MSLTHHDVNWIFNDFTEDTYKYAHTGQDVLDYSHNRLMTPIWTKVLGLVGGRKIHTSDCTSLFVSVEGDVYQSIICRKI
jgi:hypothetical protein